MVKIEIKQSKEGPTFCVQSLKNLYISTTPSSKAALRDAVELANDTHEAIELCPSQLNGKEIITQFGEKLVTYPYQIQNNNVLERVTRDPNIIDFGIKQ